MSADLNFHQSNLVFHDQIFIVRNWYLMVMLNGLINILFTKLYDSVFCWCWLWIKLITTKNKEKRKNDQTVKKRVVVNKLRYLLQLLIFGKRRIRSENSNFFWKEFSIIWNIIFHSFLRKSMLWFYKSFAIRCSSCSLTSCAFVWCTYNFCKLFEVLRLLFLILDEIITWNFCFNIV